MRCFVYETEVDIIINIFSRIVKSKGSSADLTVDVCLLCICIRKFVPISSKIHLIVSENQVFPVFRLNLNCHSYILKSNQEKRIPWKIKGGRK